MDDARRPWRRRSWQAREMSRTGWGCQQRFQTENVGATCHGAVPTHVQRRPFLCPIGHMRIPVPLCNAMHRPALPLLPIQCNRWAELPSGSEVDEVSSQPHHPCSACSRNIPIERHPAASPGRQTVAAGGKLRLKNHRGPEGGAKPTEHSWRPGLVNVLSARPSCVAINGPIFRLPSHRLRLSSLC